MIRRLQLLGPESRFSLGRVVAASSRIGEGLLRDNKVVPAVLTVLSLLIFAWIIAGALISGPDEGRREEVASQALQAQGSQNADSGDPETPPPDVEKHDTDSYSAFEKKDPFRAIIEKADENDNGGDGGDSGAGGSGNSADPSSPGTSDPEDRVGESLGGEYRRRGSSGNADHGGDGGPGGADRSGSAAHGNSGDSGRDGGADQGGNAGQAGRGDLFDSGGDLPAP